MQRVARWRAGVARWRAGDARLFLCLCLGPVPASTPAPTLIRPTCPICPTPPAGPAGLRCSDTVANTITRQAPPASHPPTAPALCLERQLSCPRGRGGKDTQHRAEWQCLPRSPKAHRTIDMSKQVTRLTRLQIGRHSAAMRLPLHVNPPNIRSASNYVLRKSAAMQCSARICRTSSCPRIVLNRVGGSS